LEATVAEARGSVLKKTSSREEFPDQQAVGFPEAGLGEEV